MEMYTSQLVLHDRCISRKDGHSVCRLVARNMGGSWTHRCGLLFYHHLLLVSFLPYLCLLSSLPPFLSCVLLGISKSAAILVCLSGMNGSTLWSSPLPEEARDITCLDLMLGSTDGTVCLVTGTHKMLSAFNATSGKGHLPWKIPAPGSHSLGSEQFGGEGTFPLSDGGRSGLLLWKVDIKRHRKKVWIDWVIDPQLNLSGVRMGLKWNTKQKLPWGFWFPNSPPTLFHVQKTAELCLFIFGVYGSVCKLGLNYLKPCQGKN